MPQKWTFATKIDSCQWKLQFQSIVDHSKIMYSCSPMQRNEIVFLLRQKQPTALKYLLTNSNQRLCECVRRRLNLYTDTLNDFPS